MKLYSLLAVFVLFCMSLQVSGVTLPKQNASSSKNTPKSVSKDVKNSTKPGVAQDTEPSKAANQPATASTETMTGIGLVTRAMKNKKDDMYRRSMIFIGVLLGISLGYFLIRSWRSSRRRQRFRRYGSGRGDKVEMARLESHPEEDSA